MAPVRADRVGTVGALSIHVSRRWLKGFTRTSAAGGRHPLPQHSPRGAIRKDSLPVPLNSSDLFLRRPAPIPYGAGRRRFDSTRTIDPTGTIVCEVACAECPDLTRSAQIIQRHNPTTRHCRYACHHTPSTRTDSPIVDAHRCVRSRAGVDTCCGRDEPLTPPGSPGTGPPQPRLERIGAWMPPPGMDSGRRPPYPSRRPS